MGESFYLDFDLILERAGEKFRARVFDSPAAAPNPSPYSTAFTSFKFNW